MYALSFCALPLLGQKTYLDSLRKEYQKTPSVTIAEKIRKEGLLQKQKGEYEEALQFYTEAIQYFSELKDNTGLAKTYNNLALLYKETGKAKESLTALYKAAEINLAASNKVDLSTNYLNIGIHYENEGLYLKAKEYFIKAKSLLKDEKGTPKIATLYLNLGALNANSKEIQNFDSSLYYYHNALEIFQVLNDKQNISFIYNNLGIVYRNMDRYDEAIKNYEKSLDIKKELGDKKGQAATLLNLGNINLELKEYQKSNEYYEKALNLAAELTDKKLYLDIITNIIKVEVALGNVQKVEPLMNEYMLLRDSLYNEEKMNQLRTLETIFETEKIEKSLAIQKEITEKTRKQNRQLLWLSIAVSLMVMISSALFYQRQKYLKRLKNEEIAALNAAQEINELNAIMHAQDEERNRIASDLHDRLGARLSSLKMLFEKSNGKPPQRAEVVKLLNKAIKETREISHSLSTDLLTRFGLVYALNDFISSIHSSGEIKGGLDAFGLQERLSITVERTIYHILLELINNTIKHAEARNFFITLSYSDGELSLIYEDDGKGFHIKEKDKNGMGLRSMKARAASINAAFDFNTAPDEGVRVSLIVRPANP